MRRFNITGSCIKSEHYMVDILNKINEIKKLVDEKSYFTINRARQYGKTTTLYILEEILSNEYVVAFISFEGIGEDSFKTDENFCKTFVDLLGDAFEFSSLDTKEKEKWNAVFPHTLKELSGGIRKLCEGKKIVLLIDEVDKSSNNKLFIDFLGMLRDKYLKSKHGKDYTFHSVILAGVHDVKNIKYKMINQGTHIQQVNEGMFNSPWNIATNFEVEMAFNPDEIATMLVDYEKDHNTNMDMDALSNEIYYYTSGYPFLVSRICKEIDEKLEKNWTKEGVEKAVKVIIKEDNTLFDDLVKNLENHKDLNVLMQDILINGTKHVFNHLAVPISMGRMYGYLKRGTHDNVVISNKIFELALMDYFIAKIRIRNIIPTNTAVNEIVKDGTFNMELCLRKFAEHYGEIYRNKDIEFLERNGRMLFLSYVRPLINGAGLCELESETADYKKIDMVIKYGKDNFLIELKIWRGEAKHNEAYSQLIGYMNSRNQDTGYLLTFDFRESKLRKCEWTEVEGKKIFDVIV